MSEQNSILLSFLESAEARSPVFIREEEIAYVTVEQGTTSIILQNRLKGTKESISLGKEAVREIHVDEVSGDLYFMMDCGGTENLQLYRLPYGAREYLAITDLPAVRHFFGGVSGKHAYLADNRRNSAHFDIVSVDLENSAHRVIVENNDNYNWPAQGGFSPNGRYLLYNKLRSQTDNALWMADLVSGSTVRVPADQVRSAETTVAWEADSKSFYLVSDRAKEFTVLAHYTVANGEFKIVEDFGADIENLALSPDGQYLVIVLNRAGRFELVIKDLLKHESKTVANLPQAVISPNQGISFKGHQFLFTIGTGARPQNIFLYDIDREAMTQLSELAVRNYPQEHLVEPVLCEYSSFDGLKVPYWLYVPHGCKAEQLPICVKIHGGPESQILASFDAFIQYLLTQGIAVVAPNVRGSTGYGKSYEQMDNVEKRLDSVRDIDSLVKHLIAEGIADPERLAVSGGSYGGFMTLSCAARYPKLWACAVDTVGMFNLKTFLENTAPYRRAHRESEYGTLAENAQLLYDVSPIAVIDQIEAPLMVVHGENDPRVPVSEARAVVQHLQDLGRPVEFLCYPDEGHGIHKLKNRIDCYSRVADFMTKHMKLKQA